MAGVFGWVVEWLYGTLIRDLAERPRHLRQDRPVGL